ncbi:MAC/perforin domain-containing protein [Fibrobacter sp. UWB3]|uniref:MAC/perforin domain-containing protein n=1 Tax=Fibrobacter sp. UWB3 TaxID=1964357 RepID=UPI000B526843|nr:MAC/perforin domain-containing protein [Fibrobacter sp. UWB3]OWV23021.1 hypothetical protein B7991_02310 [Fibrobacter sp. UWB3]
MNYSKTQKFSVEFSLICAMTAGLVACSDSDSPSGGIKHSISVEVLGKTVSDTLKFDMTDSTYDFKIEADGKWKIEDKTNFIQSISPTSGEGDATVKVRLTTNDMEERFTGNLRIEFPEDTSLNKTITVVQKYSGDYADNASELSQSNKIYAVGYGYDALTGSYADYSSLKAEIFDTKTLIEDEVISSSPTKVDVEFYKWSGSVFAEYEEWLDELAGISVDKGWFYGEYTEAFTDWTYENTFAEIAVSYANVTVKTVDFEESELDDAISSNMKKSAYAAINGLDSKYPSDNTGFKKLIQRYGTHVVLGATLGGRIRQAMASKQSYEFELMDYLKAVYGYTFNKAAYIDEEVYTSYEEEYDELNLKVTVSGGDAEKALKITDSKILKKDDVNAWKSTLAENATLVDFSGSSLMPLYELIDESLGKEAVTRKKKLKEYMESSKILSDFDVIVLK